MMWHIRMARILSSALLTVLVFAPDASRAYNPVPALRNLYGAPHAVVWLLQIKEGHEESFINTMVGTGPYDKLLSGFASEKLLEPLPVQNGGKLYVSFSRYYDKGTSEYVSPARLQSIDKELARKPIQMQMSLVEHLLADWSWEKGGSQSLLSAKAFKKDELFEQNISSLSFFKAGYVGQIGMIEFFTPGEDLKAVRAKVSARTGMSGASIYKVDGENRYVAYSEFFKAPAELSAQQLQIGADAVPRGGIAGIVVQNYVPR